MMDDLMRKILPEINDWETLIYLLRVSHPSQIGAILQKADPLVNFLDLNKLDESPIKDVEKELRYFDLKDLLVLCRDSFLGNLIWLDLLIEDSGGILESSNIGMIKYVPDLEFINEIAFIQPNFGRKMLVRLSEDPPDGVNKKEILTALRLLMQIGLIELDKELISSFKILLKGSNDPNDRKVLMLIELLENCDTEALIREYKVLTGKSAEKLDDLNQKAFYESLVEIGCPVFFNPEKIKYNGVIYNGNFFPLIYRDISGDIRILKPFDLVSIEQVQEIYNPIRDIWSQPMERLGKINLDDIFSFRDVRRVTSDKIKEDENLLSKIRELSENDIEKKIRLIVGELEPTEHTSTEIGDIYLCKIHINNEKDLRNAIVIIKKGSKIGNRQITLREIGHQFIKAVNEKNSDLIILVHIAQLADDARSSFIELCNRFNKMYCIVDVVELGRLFVAYDLI